MTTTPQDPLEALASKVADYIWITRYSSTASKDQVKNSILAALREATAELTRFKTDAKLFLAAARKDLDAKNAEIEQQRIRVDAAAVALEGFEAMKNELARLSAVETDFKTAYADKIALAEENKNLRAENERLKGYLAGTPASHVAAIFLLTNEMGHGLSSEPPVEIIRRELTLLRQDRKRLADIALSVCDSIPDSMSFGQSALRDAAASAAYYAASDASYSADYAASDASYSADYAYEYADFAAEVASQRKIYRNQLLALFKEIAAIND